MSISGRVTNWPRIIAWMCAVAIVVAWVAVACAQEPSCATWELPAGAVLATRNSYEPDNSFPCPEPNHLATGVGRATDGRIYLVEAQTPPYGNGVKYTSLDEFRSRPYYVPWVYEYRDPAAGQRAAAIARKQVGAPYGKWASLGPQRVRSFVADLLGRTRPLNCVDTVRLQAEGATARALWGFNTPVDINTRPDIFKAPYLLPQNGYTPDPGGPVVIKPGNFSAESPPPPLPAQVPPVPEAVP